MSKMIKTSLIALSLLAAASAGYAADNNGGRNDRADESRIDAPDVWEREKMVDPGTTGSIEPCESQSFDEFGNCIANPNTQ